MSGIDEGKMLLKLLYLENKETSRLIVLEKMLCEQNCTCTCILYGMSYILNVLHTETDCWNIVGYLLDMSDLNIEEMELFVCF